MLLMLLVQGDELTAKLREPETMSGNKCARRSLELCGAILAISLLIAEAQPIARAMANPDAGSADALSSTVLRGVRTADLSPSLRQKLGVDAGLTGVVVTEVAPDTPAALAGLHRDDLIQTVGIYSDPLLNRVARPADFTRLAGKATHEVRLLVRHRLNGRYDVSTWVLVRDSGGSLSAASLPSDSAGSNSPRAAHSVDVVENNISTIRRGPHGAMPQASAESKKLGGKAGLVIRNETSYTLFLYLSGPAHQTIEIPAGQTRDFSLVPGRYEVAAKASKPEVIPFYGVKDLIADTLYSEVFQVETRKD